MNENLPVALGEEARIRQKKGSAGKKAVAVAVLAVLLIASAVTVLVGKETFMSRLFEKAQGASDVKQTDNATSDKAASPEKNDIYSFDKSSVPSGFAAFVPVDITTSGEKFTAVVPEKASGKVVVLSTRPYQAYSDGSLSYADENYAATGGERTTAKVAEFLASELRRRGIDADYLPIDTTTGRDSYASAAEKINEYAKGAEIYCVIDIQRASSVDGDGNILRPICADKDTIYAQTCFIAAKNGKKYDERASNAASLAEKMNAVLEKSAAVKTRDGVLNQDISPVFFTAEVGACGNSYAEAIRAASVIAKGFSDMIK